MQGLLGPAPRPHPHHLGTCPEPGTSAGGSVGIGCGWCGQWGSSADGCRSRPHYTAGCGERSPGEQRLLIPSRSRSRWSWVTFPHQDKVLLLPHIQDPHQVCICRPVPATHLAPLTGDDPIVDPRRLIPTDLARYYFNLCWKRGREMLARDIFLDSTTMSLGC